MLRPLPSAEPYFFATQHCADAAELIALRIEVARKRQKAMHGRREMTDEEIKADYSNA